MRVRCGAPPPRTNAVLPFFACMIVWPSPALEMPAERQPKGPVEEAGAGHIECEKCGLGQHFPIDRVLDERHVVHDREMRAFPDMKLQPRIGEPSPTESMPPRYV